ncbi:AlbA family DNA-binding domain-containing protein [Micromonospora carbonacea]|uniref:AlbA family DNA-binding domain-containing protein n=1 Tax=Micromonospora carbonacea TaxID=47853 RepID=UPI0037187411
MEASPRAVNLGPDHGMWRPRAWQDIVDAAAGGLLDESRWVDLKRELKPGRPGNNDLAVDIAAMSLEGGLLLYGIVDHESRAGQVVGVELAGLADRVDQVARMKVHPAAQVRSVEISDPDRPGWGCLLVIVPPSARAPHMVDNVYYGRGDRANHKLSDQEVRQALNTRAQHQHDVAQQLHLLRNEDPVPPPHDHGHLYVIAQPLAASDDALVELITGPQFQQTILLAAASITTELGSTWAPTLRSASRVQRRADGAAFVSYDAPDRISEHSLVELVLREDGGVALTCGRGTDTWSSHAGADPERILIPVVVLGLTHSVLTMAGRLAQQFSGYQGQWSVGVLLDNLKGVGPYDGRLTWGDMGSPYSRAEYEQLATTDTEELIENCAAVVERLLGKLMRSLGVDSRYLPYSTESLRKSPR